MSSTDLSWSLAGIWNQSLEQRPKKELKPRAKIWASEIGGAMIDRYLKMMGERPSNPFSARSLRKFEAGNLAEWVVGMVLKRAGIAYEAQKWSSFRYPGQLEVTGKADYVVEGKPDWEEAGFQISKLELPEFFGRATDAIMDHFSKSYPDGLRKVVLEIKSCSGMMFDKYQNLGPDPRHQCQLFHYLKADNLPEGHIVYFSKDDLRLAEFGVMNPSPVEDLYRDDIEAISHYYTRGIRPEKEKEVIFDEFSGKFSANFKVGYSTYLTALYDFQDQAEFDTKYKPQVARWNRTLGRILAGANMTDLNKQSIEEIKKEFPDFDEKVEILKAKGIKIEENEEGGETTNG